MSSEVIDVLDPDGGVFLVKLVAELCHRQGQHHALLVCHGQNWLGEQDTCRRYRGLVAVGHQQADDHFAAIANFNKIIATAGSGSGSVTSLARRVTGPEDVRSVAVRGPAGRYLLLVWRETQIWDPLRQRSLNVSARQVAIDWGSSPRTVTTYWPSRSAEPTDRAQERVTTVNLAAELAILEVAA